MPRGVHRPVADAHPLGSREAVLPGGCFDHDLPRALRHRLAAPQHGRPAQAHRPRDRGRIDEEARRTAQGADAHAGGARDGEADRHTGAGLAAHEPHAVHLELAHDQHLPESEQEGARDLGRDLGRVELAVGIDENRLLEGVHRLERGVHRAVRRSQELVGAPPLGAAQRLAQRSVRQYDRLREVELVVRLQRLAQRGAAHRLRPSGCRRQDERHEPQSPPRPPRPRHGCSWMSV